MKLLEQQFLMCDSIKNPLHDLKINAVNIRSSPINLQSTASEKKYEYIPPWWQESEELAYSNVKVAMDGIKALPKMAGT